MSSCTLSILHAFFLFALAASLAHGHSNCRFTDDEAKSQSIRFLPTKGMFVFGSSLVDSGNNNFLKTLAKANYAPYGVDYRFGPSGRYTNGKNVVDFFAEYLRLPSYIPPFSDPATKGAEAVQGVNFASGGSGILDDTGSIAGEVMNLKQQISSFEEVTLGELETQLGCKSSESLSHYLFLVGSGGNDYTLNYFLRNPDSNSGSNDSLRALQAFTSNLTASLSLHLQKLYSLGGRKFVLMALNPLGCSPSANPRTPSTVGCVESLNRAAQFFNSNLRTLVDHLNSYLTGSHFVLVDSYKIITDIINDPLPKGFRVTGTPCCEVPTLAEGGNGVLCKKDGQVCANRRTHVFFDGLHPTEAVNVHIATKGFSSLRSSEVYPFNVHRLASI